jgi:hypothetical protein
MKRNILILALATVTIISTNSCQKEDTGGTTELQKKATELQNYVVNNKFIPVDFYSDTPIDYVENDATVLAETDLKKYIFQYLTDDEITFNPDKTLLVNQGTIKMEGETDQTFTRTWGTETNKAKNLVYLNYLDYFYEPRRYTLVEWTDTSIIAYVDWTSKADPTKTAKIYTRFQKK